MWVDLYSKKTKCSRRRVFRLQTEKETGTTPAQLCFCCLSAPSFLYTPVEGRSSSVVRCTSRKVTARTEPGELLAGRWQEGSRL